MNFRKMLISNARKAMLDNIEALDKKTLQKELKKSLQEQFRLNNIINELEKLLKEGSFDVYFCSTSSQKTFKSNEIIIKAMILDKLKELKGSDKK